MRVAGLLGGVILVLLIGLSGTLPYEKVVDLQARWKKFTGSEKPATRSGWVRVFDFTRVNIKFKNKIEAIDADNPFSCSFVIFSTCKPLISSL